MLCVDQYLEGTLTVLPSRSAFTHHSFLAPLLCSGAPPLSPDCPEYTPPAEPFALDLQIICGIAFAAPPSWGSLQWTEPCQMLGPLYPQSAYTGLYGNPSSRVLSIDVGSQGLTGTLPIEVSHLQALEHLAMPGNALTGELPMEWSALLSLTALRLDLNQLNGTLPAAWSAIPGIDAVNINENLLTGTLPPEWSAWANTTAVSFRENQLRGTLPASWSAMHETPIL